jgi:hypothetical protein
MNSLGRNSLIACAVATALGTSAAHALAPSATIDFTFYAAGGSAQANAFYVAFSDNATNVDSYTNTTNGTDSGQYRVLFGTTTAAITFNGFTIPSGKNVLYMYKFNGGSYTNGIAPQVGAGSTLAYPTTASIVAATAIGGAVAGTGVPTYAYAANTGTTAIPDWGVADLEVSMFQGFNNPTGNAGGTVKNTNGGAAPTVGATTGLYDNLFGIAVTHNVYTGTHPKTSFSRAEMEGIIEGTVSDWSQLFADDGAQMAAGGIIFLDRGEGSGSKASGNQYFLGYPGDGSSARLPFSSGAAYTSAALAATGTETPQDIAEASSSTLVADLKLAQSTSRRAIGVLGLEFPPALNQLVAGTNSYDFTKINGLAVDTGGASDNINGSVGTSYINVVKGNYDYYYQNSFNTRAGFLAGANANAAFANQILKTMTTAGFVGADTGGGFPGGVPGTLLDADLFSTLTSTSKGTTLNTRNKVSTAPLQPKLSAIATGIPVSNDPL